MNDVIPALEKAGIDPLSPIGTTLADACVNECESEIECDLLVAIALNPIFDFHGRRGDIWPLWFLDPKLDAHPRPGLRCIVIPQAGVLNYRVDFLIGSRGSERSALVVVECDGHDFHERTREQAAHDKRRDRRLTAAGHTVFRFTGSEIYRNAAGCAAETMNFVAAQCGWRS